MDPQVCLSLGGVSLSESYRSRGIPAVEHVDQVLVGSAWLVGRSPRDHVNPNEVGTSLLGVLE